jgi:hypothetical protein
MYAHLKTIKISASKLTQALWGAEINNAAMQMLSEKRKQHKLGASGLQALEENHTGTVNGKSNCTLKMTNTKVTFVQTSNPTPMKHFRTFLPAMALAALFLTGACSPMKLATVNEEITAIKGGQTAGNYYYEITKKRKDPIEILEVIHIDLETGERNNLSFSLFDTTKKRKLLTLKGETAFVIHAKGLSKGEPKPHRAEIIYKKGADGKRKTIKVKNPEPAKS